MSADSDGERSRSATIRRSRKRFFNSRDFRRISAASGALHLRNDHANVQYRVNGILLPDGVSGFAELLDHRFRRQHRYHRRRASGEWAPHDGIVDVTPKSAVFDGGGNIEHLWRKPRDDHAELEYGGTIGGTEYYVDSIWLLTNEGIENANSAPEPDS